MLDASRAVGVARRLMGSGRATYLDGIARGIPEGRRDACARHGRQAAGDASRGAEGPLSHRLGGYMPAAADLPRHAALRATTRSPSCPLYRLDAVLRGLGDQGDLSAPLRRSEGRAGRALAVRRCPGDAQADGRRELAHGKRRSSASGRRTPRATTSSSTPTRGGRRSGRGSTRSASRSRGRTASAAMSRCPTSSRRPRQRRADFIGGFAVTAGIGEEAVAERFARGQRRLLQDPEPGARRPAGGGLRRADARACPARVLGLCPGRSLHTAELIREAYAASGRRRVIPPNPTTPRSRPCSTSSTRKLRPASG